MKAILGFPVPESCRACGIKMIELATLVKCPETGKNDLEVAYTTSQHPDCPLKIQPDCLRWKIAKRTENWECPICKADFNFIIMAKFHHCPSLCGVRLLPMEKVTDAV